MGISGNTKLAIMPNLCVCENLEYKLDIPDFRRPFLSSRLSMTPSQPVYWAGTTVCKMLLDQSETGRKPVCHHTLSVADPGFPRRGGDNPPGGGPNIRFCQIFPKTA